MKKYHEIDDIHFTDDTLTIKIDGQHYEYPLAALSEKVATASERIRNQYEISPSGYGIHWPLLDEDITIDGLLGIKHTPQRIKEAASV